MARPKRVQAASPQRSPLEFPCRYPIKAMIRSGEQSVDRLLGAVRLHGPAPGPDEVSVRASRHGRFQSITVPVEVRSRSQLEAIYAEISALDGVVMTL